MFNLSFKSIFHNKSRFFCTVIGFFIATVILNIGIYFLYISNAVVNESFNLALAEQRVLLNEVTVNGIVYYDTEEGFTPHIIPIGESTIFDIATSDGVEAVHIQYQREETMTVVFDGITMKMERPLAVDSSYSIFSKALIDSVEKKDGSIKAMVAGEMFTPEEPMTMMLAECTVKALGVEPEDIIGKIVTALPGNGKEYAVKITGVYTHALSGYYRRALSEFHPKVCIGSDKDMRMGVDFLFNKGFFEQLSMEENTVDSFYPSAICVTLNSYDAIEALIMKIQTRYSLNPRSDYMSYYKGIQQMTKQSTLFILFGIVIFLLSVLLNFNTMLINISQQKRFIRLLRLLGYRRIHINIIHALQSFLYGVIGAGLGFVVSYLGCTVLGLAMYSGLKARTEAMSSSIFMMPVQYAIIIVCCILFLNIISGIGISISKTKKA